MSRSTCHTWIATLVAVFMVLVLPACWYGALERSNLFGTAAPSNANNNEEREEHEEHEVATTDVAGRRPPPPPKAGPRATPKAIQRAHVRVRIAESVAHPAVPSKLSERRLI
jgi:hypothetical protein